MFERLDTPQDAHNFELGAALKMDHTVLDMVDKLADAAGDEDLKQLSRRHLTRRSSTSPISSASST